jgi:hypothetical protein
MWLGSTVRQLLAGVFVATLGLYSLVWMYYTRNQDDTPAVGIGHEYRPSESSLHLTRVMPGGPAAEAGLQPGDRVSAVNGVPLTRLRPLLDALGRGAAGDVVTFTVTSEDAPRPRDVPVRLVRSGDLRIWSGPSIALDDWAGGPTLTALVLGAMNVYPLVFLAVLAFVLLQRPDDRNAWAMSFAFAGFIGGAPLLQLEAALPHQVRGFMVGTSLGLLDALAGRALLLLRGVS